ncbi:MAG: SpoIID/LytB domain-containing protein [Bacillota bacterium]
MFYRLPTVLLMILMAIILCGGCRLKPGVPEPLAEPEAPALPDALQQEDGREPVIKVFLHEEATVEEMNFEEYIAGVVAAEMDPKWHKEALAAQAIIARSFTLQKIAEQGGVPDRNAHASTDIREFQAYDASRINEQVRNAVNQTRGQVAVYQGSFIRGWFHAFAGPRTASAVEGLEFKGGEPPYIQIVDSPGQDLIPEDEGNWSTSFSAAQFRDAVAELSGSDPGAISEVEVSAKGPSGRATRIKVNGVEVSAPSLRLALGSTEMRSTFLEDLSVEGETVAMSGKGYGHGVGMCQWGARALAEDGWSSEDIVHYFYRNVDIVQVWP